MIYDMNIWKIVPSIATTVTTFYTVLTPPVGQNWNAVVNVFREANPIHIGLYTFLSPL